MPTTSVQHEYEIENRLGEGGMGIVYRARDTRLGRSVALKRLHPELTSDPERKSRFLQEARAAAAISHPAVAQIYDVGEDESGVFIAMELVNGRPLQELIRSRALDVIGSLQIAIQLAGGLQKAHEAGIVHRDIKPANVIVTPEGHAKILDFGLAKVLARAEDAEVSHAETLAKTRPGVLVGTLAYMSPEQARGLPVDARTDIFALGALLYEMLTGERPFSGPTAIDTLHAITFEDPRPLHDLRGREPAALGGIVARCLRKDPAQRYSDCRALVADLKTASHEAESGISSRPSALARVRDVFRPLNGMGRAETVVTYAAALVALTAFALLMAQVLQHLGLVLLVTVVGLSLWRRARHRHLRLARRFVDKARKVPDVRLVSLQASALTVVTDRATPEACLRLRAVLDALNASTYFGEPLTLVIREGLPDDEIRHVVAAPGLMYVRDAPRTAGHPNETPEPAHAGHHRRPERSVP
jgi:predicted Ser/Thr protein kinase